MRHFWPRSHSEMVVPLFLEYYSSRTLNKDQESLAGFHVDTRNNAMTI